MELIRTETKYVLETVIELSGGYLPKKREFDTKEELITQLGKIPIIENFAEAYEKTIIVPSKDMIQYV